MIVTDLIEFQAIRNPNAIAVVAPSGPVTFRQLMSHVRRVAVALSERIPGSRQRVGIDIAERYQHWVLILALARLGHNSTWISPGGDELRALALDVLLSDGRNIQNSGAKTEVLSDQWFRQAAGRAPPLSLGVRPREPDPVRIILSSGTTGTPKKVLLSHAQLLTRISHAAFSQNLGPLSAASRMLSLMGEGSMGGFLAPFAVWAAGGSVLLGPTEWALRELFLAASHGSTVLLASPAQVADVLKMLPPGWLPSRNLSVTVGGSSLPRALSRDIRLRLTPNLILAYGSTEAGVVANAFAGRPEIEDGATGVVFPWVRVEAVDEEHRPVSPGSIGQIRIKSPDCVDKYYEEGPGSPVFRNGWFYPGDLGSVSPVGILTIVGRVSEVINIGGVKLSPDFVEAAVRKARHVEDVAVFSIERGSGVDQLWVAVVAGRHADLDGIASACEAQTQVKSVHVLRVDRIPRNAMGKIDRQRLRSLVAARP